MIVLHSFMQLNSPRRRSRRPQTLKVVPGVLR